MIPCSARRRWLSSTLSILALAAAACTPSGSSSPSDAGPECTFHLDCLDHRVCVDGQCRTPTQCTTTDDWISCAAQMDRLKAGLGRQAYCDLDIADAGVCQLACIEDSECPPSHICTDFGKCRPANVPTGMTPGTGTAGPLKMGYGQAELDVPVGVPLGGYGGRFDPTPSRYGGGLAASRGHMEGLDVRAVALENGEGASLIVRVPLIFVDQSMHEEVAILLQEHTGRDWRDALILTATHTHSGPARLWPLPPRTILPLGVLGAGDHSRFFYDHVVKSIAEAARQAVDNLQPARLGWSIVESFDTDDQVGRDRREQTPPWDDNRLLVIRVDGLDGQPAAVLFSYGAHGTANETDYLTGDALAGAERGLEAWLGRTYGKHVPALFVNQNSGTMSPVDGADQGVPTMFERAGEVMVQKASAAIQGINTRANVVLKSRTIRVPYTYRSVGFGPGEWTNPATDEPPLGGEYIYGGIQCFGNYEPGDDLAAFMPLEDAACFGLHAFGFNIPPTPLTKTMVTALSLDGLAVVTMPGELSMELSWLVLRKLQEDHGINPLQAFTWGYAQDHQLYLLPDVVDGPRPPFPGLSTPMAPSEYPPHAFSFLRGGYESSLSHLATRGGDYLVRMASSAWRALERPMDVPSLLPLRYTPPVEVPFPVDDTPVARAGVVVQQVPGTVKRLEPVEFAFVGGDPLVEAPLSPLVTLQKEQAGGGFTAVLTESRVPYTNRDAAFITRLRKNGDDWEWVVRWEETQRFPAGTYRFHVEGHHRVPGTQRAPYSTDSAPFQLVARDDLAVGGALSGRDIVGTVAYPAGERFRIAATNEDPGRCAGSHRLRHVDLPVDVPAPLALTTDVSAANVAVQLRQGTVVAAEFNASALSTAVETVNGRPNTPVTRYTAPIPMNVAAGTYQATITVTDRHGNTGVSTVEIVLP